MLAQVSCWVITGCFFSPAQSGIAPVSKVALGCMGPGVGADVGSGLLHCSTVSKHVLWQSGVVLAQVSLSFCDGVLLASCSSLG